MGQFLEQNVLLLFKIHFLVKLMKSLGARHLAVYWPPDIDVTANQQLLTIQQTEMDKVFILQ